EDLVRGQPHFVLHVDEASRIRDAELREQLLVRAVRRVAEHQLPIARREGRVVAAERGPVAGQQQLVIPRELDKRVRPFEENRFEHAATLAAVARRILWALLALTPAVLVSRYVFELDETTLFILAALALIPLAWLIGEATEHAAEHTGAGVGGFLNASFGKE